MGVFYAFLLLGLAIGLPLALPLLLVDLLSARLLQPLLALALKVPGLLPLVGSLLLLPGLLQHLQIPVQLLPAVVVAAPAVLALLPASAFQSLLRVPLPSGGGPPRRRVACRLVATRSAAARAAWRCRAAWASVSFRACPARRSASSLSSAPL